MVPLLIRNKRTRTRTGETPADLTPSGPAATGGFCCYGNLKTGTFFRHQRLWTHERILCAEPPSRSRGHGVTKGCPPWRTTCWMTRRLPPPDDGGGAPWLEGSQSAARRKGRLSGPAGPDRASIQQHLLHQAATSRKTSLFFRDRPISSFTPRQNAKRLEPPRGDLGAFGRVCGSVSGTGPGRITSTMFPTFK